MKRARKVKTALQRYIEMDGPEPLAVLRGLLNRALEAGDFVSAERLAGEMAPYKHARLSAVAGQLEMFGTGPDGAPIRPALDSEGRTLLTFQWLDFPPPPPDLPPMPEFVERVESTTGVDYMPPLVERAVPDEVMLRRRELEIEIADLEAQLSAAKHGDEHAR